mgnify:CR=1 FL=1
MIAPALFNSLRRRSFSRSSFSIFVDNGLTGLAFLPRFRGVRPDICPDSFCFRQVNRWEWYTGVTHEFFAEGHFIKI